MSHTPWQSEPQRPWDERPGPPSQQPVPYEQSGGYLPAQPYPQQPYLPQPTAYGQPMSPGYYPGLTDPRQQAYASSLYGAQKSRIAAGLLAIFLGTLGIHNFYLGRVGIGILQLVVTVLSIGFLAPLVFIWSLIEGILILTRSPSFATDRKGIPLRD